MYPQYHHFYNCTCRLIVLGIIMLSGLTMISCSSSDDCDIQSLNNEDRLTPNTGIALNNFEANVLQASVEPFSNRAADISATTDVDISDSTYTDTESPNSVEGLTCDVKWGCSKTARAARASNTGYTLQWEKIGSATQIAIQPRSYAATSYSTYKVNTSGAITATSPYYFETASSDVITSWYPYNSGSLASFTVQTDQSSLANYIASDLLYTSAAVSSTSQSLTYSHKMAQIIVDVKVSNANYLTNSEVQSLVISGLKNSCTTNFASLSGNAVRNPTFTTGTSTANIKAYPYTKSSTATTSTATFIMCVPAQTIATTQTFTITVGGTAYTGKLTTAQNLLSGYAYNISIGLTASPYLFHNATSVEIGYFYGKYANGQPVIIKNTASDISTAKTKGITPVALIFSKTTSSTDDTSNGWIHGYAMSLKNVSTSAAWRTSGSGTDLSKQWGTDYANAIKNYDGYKYTKEIVKNKTLSNYPAFNAAYTYNVAVSGASSGWYLPSIGQWYLLLTNVGKASGSTSWNGTVAYWQSAVFSLATLKSNLNTAFGFVGSGNYDQFHDASNSLMQGYWSSSECTDTEPVYLLYNNDNDTEFYRRNVEKTVGKYVRAVLSF